ncbi:MAG: hypothetical protein QXP01_01210, partial [Candidatus Hadarchaeum sp.]
MKQDAVSFLKEHKFMLTGKQMNLLFDSNGILSAKTDYGNKLSENQRKVVENIADVVSKRLEEHRK